MNKKLFIISILTAIFSLILFICNLQTPLDDIIYKYFIFNDTLTNVFKFITIFGNATMIFVAVLWVFIYFSRKKNYKKGLLFCGFSILSVGVMGALKLVFKRQRPTINQLIEINGFSFPSGHAYLSMVVYGYIIYLIYVNTKGKYRKVLITLFSILIFLIGISRIYLGVHYLTDILFGYSLGLLSLTLYIQLEKKILIN